MSCCNVQLKNKNILHLNDQHQKQQVNVQIKKFNFETKLSGIPKQLFRYEGRREKVRFYEHFSKKRTDLLGFIEARANISAEKGIYKS